MSPLTPRRVLSLCEVRQSARQRRNSQSALLASHSQLGSLVPPKLSPIVVRVLDGESRSTPINSDQLRYVPSTFLVASALSYAISRIHLPMFNVYVIENKNVVLSNVAIELHLHRISPSSLAIDRPISGGEGTMKLLHLQKEKARCRCSCTFYTLIEQHFYFHCTQHLKNCAPFLLAIDKCHYVTSLT